MNLVKLVVFLSSGFGTLLIIIFGLMCIFHNLDFMMKFLALLFWFIVIGGAIVSFISMFK